MKKSVFKILLNTLFLLIFKFINKLKELKPLQIKNEIVRKEESVAKFI